MIGHPTSNRIPKKTRKRERDQELSPSASRFDQRTLKVLQRKSREGREEIGEKIRGNRKPCGPKRYGAWMDDGKRQDVGGRIWRSWKSSGRKIDFILDRLGDVRSRFYLRAAVRVQVPHASRDIENNTGSFSQRETELRYNPDFSEQRCDLVT